VPGDVFRVIMRYPVGRWALFALWLRVGWHFLHPRPVLPAPVL